MRDRILLTLIAGSIAVLVGCGTPSGSDGGHDAGVTDAGGGDAGTAPLTTVATQTTLPSPWQSSNAADFASDGGSAALPYLNGLVEFSGQTTTQGQTADGGGTCPAPLVYQTYCNGFQANATGGGSFLVDTYDFAGSPSQCASQDNGVTIPTIRGIWYDSNGAYAIAMTSCADIGIGTGYTGNATPPQTPAGSKTVSAFLASNPADGSAVKVSGIVVGVGGSTLALEDPNGGPNSAALVYFGSTTLANPPNIGDYVTVVGTWSQQYQNISL
jgi:hypothetical protein